MNNRGQVIIGAALVFLGLVFLIGTIFQIDVWAFCFPVGLIVIGVWLVTRPRLSASGRDSEVMLIGDVRRRGNWSVREQELWLGISDVDLDFASADIPAGETKFFFYSFVGDVDIFVPRGVGVSVRTFCFFVDAELLGRDYERFLSPVEVVSENYAAAERRLHFELTGFVSDIKVKHV
jgi:predicted membrane protein